MLRLSAGTGRRASRGFSLKEMAVVFAVMALMTGSIVKLVGNVRQTHNSNLLLQQVVLSVKGINTYFAGRVVPTSATTYTQAQLRAAGIFPEDICPANCVSGTITQLINAYGGQIQYSSDRATYTDLEDGQYYLIVDSIPKHGCIILGARLGSDAVRMGLLTYKRGATSYTSFPMTSTQIDGMCTTTNTISMRFKINP